MKWPWTRTTGKDIWEMMCEEEDAANPEPVDKAQKLEPYRRPGAGFALSLEGPLGPMHRALVRAILGRWVRWARLVLRGPQ